MNSFLTINLRIAVRTPVNAIVGMLELIQLTELSTTQQNYMEVAKTASEALFITVNNLLDMRWAAS